MPHLTKGLPHTCTCTSSCQNCTRMTLCKLWIILFTCAVHVYTVYLYMPVETHFFIVLNFDVVHTCSVVVYSLISLKPFNSDRNRRFQHLYVLLLCIKQDVLDFPDIVLKIWDKIILRYFHSNKIAAKSLKCSLGLKASFSGYQQKTGL